MYDKIILNQNVKQVAVIITSTFSRTTVERYYKIQDRLPILQLKVGAKMKRAKEHCFLLINYY